MVEQASLDGVGSTDTDQSGDPSDSSGDSQQATNSSDGNNDADPYEFVKYLDVNSLKLIHALAGTLSSIEEADKYIQAERKRWNRDEVLRILQAKKEDLTQPEPNP